MRLSDGGFGACQVTGVEGGVTSAYALRWHSVDWPILDELRGVEPLMLDHHAHGGRLAHVSIGSWHAAPPGFTWIGSLPVPEGVPALSNTYSGWQSLADDVVRQRRWDRELPAAAKDAYRAAATRGQVDVDFGAGAGARSQSAPPLRGSDGGRPGPWPRPGAGRPPFCLVTDVAGRPAGR